MKPRAEVTVRMTKKQHRELLCLVKDYVPDRTITDELARALFVNHEIDPLLDERVTVGHSFRRGTG